jgi:endonuclease/exonuclease/phosphatase family metal-dependent hydrolase
MVAWVGEYTRGGLVRTTALAMLCASWVFGGSAAAQTTVVLNQPAPQVTDTTIRNGAYRNTNYDKQTLVTRSSADPDWERRTIVKFDTKNTIPEGARIVSATLTMTVKSAEGTSTTPVQAFRITQPFQESDATWITRQYSEKWATVGGDMAEAYGGAYVPATAGSKVSFDVTTLVQRAVNGDFDSRYTRIGLADTGNKEKYSYREYYASEDPTVSRRPTLTVVLASTTSAPPATSTGTTLKVMQWNIQGSSYIDQKVALIAKIRPDVISFNEMPSGSLAAYASKLKAATGQNWDYVWEFVDPDHNTYGYNTVAVFSRFPIEGETSHFLSYDRSAQDARITVNGRTINFTSTHLDHRSSAYRLTEVKQLKTWLAGIAEQRIVAGDFNWYPGTTEINEMALSYNDSWAVAKSKGTAVGAPGYPDGQTKNNRIDYIWYSKGASALSVVSCQVYPLQYSDHRAVVTTFKVN